MKGFQSIVYLRPLPKCKIIFMMSKSPKNKMAAIRLINPLLMLVIKMEIKINIPLLFPMNAVSALGKKSECSSRGYHVFSLPWVFFQENPWRTHCLSFLVMSYIWQTSLFQAIFSLMNYLVSIRMPIHVGCSHRCKIHVGHNKQISIKNEYLSCCIIDTRAIPFYMDQFEELSMKFLHDPSDPNNFLDGGPTWRCM